MFEKRISGHTTRVPPAGFKFEPATNGIQFYVIANLDIHPSKGYDRSIYPSPNLFANGAGLATNDNKEIP